MHYDETTDIKGVRNAEEKTDRQTGAGHKNKK